MGLFAAFCGSDQPFDANERASTPPSSVCTYKQLTAQAFIKIKNETPKTVYGIITKMNYMFIREILEGTSDNVMTCALNQAMYYNM